MDGARATIGAVALLALAGMAQYGLASTDNEPAAIPRHYAYANDRRIHYRRLGEGPPLVMVHASPGSSFSLESRIRHYSANHTVIAIDSPGYGESAPLSETQPTLNDYADALAETLSALKLKQVDLYGTHTGAGIALFTAARHPDSVRRLALDGLPVYDDQERDYYLANYTPSLEPRWDGSHLVTLWAMRRDMYVFSPWFERTRDARRKGDLPSPNRLHDLAVDFLRAGPGYWKGYHAVFRSDPKAALSELKQPALIVARPTDSLVRHLPRLDKLPPTVRLETNVEDTDAAIAGFLAEGKTLGRAPAPVPVTWSANQVRRDYVNASHGQILMRKVGREKGRPLVLLHASPGSSRGMEPFMLKFAAERPVITFDNPGNGDSAPLPGSPDLSATAGALGGAIRQLGIRDYDLYGTHTGAMIAMEVALADPKAVKHLILDGITLFSPEFTEELLTTYVEPLEVHVDGRHLIWAWNFLRDVGLWWPHYNRTAAGAEGRGGAANAERLNASILEFLKGGRTFHHNYQAAFAYPTAARLPLIETPMLICASETDPLAASLDEARLIVPEAQVEVTEGRSSERTLDLYRSFMAD